MLFSPGTAAKGVMPSAKIQSPGPTPGSSPPRPTLLAALKVLGREMAEDNESAAAAYRRKTWPKIIRAAIAKAEEAR
jgi:hypothetical protein